MTSIFYNLKTKIGLTISSALSALGAGSGTATAVCQTTCSTGSAMPFFLGLTLSATPFAFIEDYQLVLWWIAFAVFVGLVALYIKKILHSKTDRAFIVLNAGLLLIGFPYFRDILILLSWVGLGVVIFGVYLLVSAKRIAIRWT